MAAADEGTAFFCSRSAPAGSFFGRTVREPTKLGYPLTPPIFRVADNSAPERQEPGASPTREGRPCTRLCRRHCVTTVAEVPSYQGVSEPVAVHEESIANYHCLRSSEDVPDAFASASSMASCPNRQPHDMTLRDRSGT